MTLSIGYQQAGSGYAPSAVQGDQASAAVAAAFGSHEARIRGLLLGMTRDPEVAADLSQDAFVRLLEETARGRQPDDVGAWLYRTATNLAISRARRASVARRMAPLLLDRGQPETPEAAALEREEADYVEALLDRLPADDRLVLVLSAHGVPGKAIAARLGKRHGAVRTRITRARARMRDSVDREAAASSPVMPA